MKELLRKILITLVLIVIGIPLLILFLPFIIIFSIFEHFKQKRFIKEYNNYLLSIEGKKFFFYNNRKNNHHYVEKNIISKLTDDVEYVFLEGKNLKSEFNRKYLSHMLFNVSDRKDFPYLIKINNGKALDKSINSKFYNFKNQNKNPQDLIVLINTSFDNLKSTL